MKYLNLQINYLESTEIYRCFFISLLLRKELVIVCVCVHVCAL
jgi:hypothetical protein